MVTEAITPGWDHQGGSSAASRPGDGSLTCEQLESELVASAQDPAVQSHVAQSGAAAKEKMDAMNAASGRIATQTALTLFSSLVPGGASAGMAAMAGQAQAQQPSSRK